MTTSDYIALGALIISIIAMVISYITSTKKYELTLTQRNELITWYQETIELLILMREYLSSAVEFDKITHLARLSALIEQGRFYFPNVVKKDDYGSKKPSAYQGYREVTLEYLVFSYDIIKKDDAANYIDHLNHLQRLFTSRVFDVLSPRKYNKLVKRYTLIPLHKGINSTDFMRSDPELYFSFYYGSDDNGSVSSTHEKQGVTP